MPVLGASVVNVLVMTGTTGFPKLERQMIKLAASNPALHVLIQSPNELLATNRVSTTKYIDMESFDTNPYSLMVGHCGAGTVFWALERRLPLIAIVDLDRHDDHQLDLGNWLSRSGFGMTLVNRAPTGDEIEQIKQVPLKEYHKDPFRIDSLWNVLEGKST